MYNALFEFKSNGFRNYLLQQCHVIYNGKLSNNFSLINKFYKIHVDIFENYWANWKVQSFWYILCIELKKKIFNYMTNICMSLRFIWIMGTAMAYSFTGLLRRVTPKYQIFLKIFKRTCILFVLGLLINTEGCEGKDILYVHKHIQKKKKEFSPL